MKKYFGTDGIRGVVNQFPITSEIISKVGMALGSRLNKNKSRVRVVIGKDTRLSGYMIESALTAGFVSVGIDVFLVGPVPTPAISMLTKSLRANLGIMISASHNPYHDNGIKIFNYNGYKLSDKEEKDIEKLIEDSHFDLAKPINMGKVKRLEDAKGRYIEYIKNSFPKKQNLNNIKIALDCANGSSYSIAPTILWEMGAEVVTIANNPDGLNINENCGSTKPQLLSQTVINSNSDIGIALDGDGDRLVIVDEKGNVIDGDKIIGLIAQKLHQEGKLKRDTVVVTNISNLALEEYLKYHGINTIYSDVGDKYVLEQMKECNCNFGGEKSGHIILRDYSNTGDGLLSSLQILSLLLSLNKKVSEITDIFTLNPQVMENIALKNSSYDEIVNNELFVKEVELSKNKLRSCDGRIIIRKSGTENILRIMIEGKDENKIKELQKRLSDIVISLC